MSISVWRNATATMLVHAQCEYGMIQSNEVIVRRACR